jgi:hypothetical protein
VPVRSPSVGAALSPSRATCPQIQIGKPSLPEHRAVASQAGDGDRERLLQASKTGERRALVRSAQLEPGDGGTAAVPADDLPGKGVGLRRPGDSQLITSRPNNAEGIPTRACGTAPGGSGSARMPVTAACWLSAHAEAGDPSDDPSPAAASSAVVPPIGSAFAKNATSKLCWSYVWASGCEATWDLTFTRARVAGIRATERLRASCRLSALPRRSEPAISPATVRRARTGLAHGSRSIRASVEA